MKEIFKQIKNYENYEVSNLGRVRNIKTGRFISQHLINTGYLKVDLYRDGKGTNLTVHRLVAVAFLGENKGLIVNHKNGEKLDNNLDNLEFCTYSENNLHAYRTGLRLPYRKKVTLFKNGVYISSFHSLTAVAEHLEISTGWASRLIAEKRVYRGFKMVYAA